MKTPLLVKFEIAANELEQDLKHAETIQNKEMKFQKVHDIIGRAIQIRMIINEEPSLNIIYQQLEDLTERAFQVHPY